MNAIIQGAYYNPAPNPGRIANFRGNSGGGTRDARERPDGALEGFREFTTATGDGYGKLPETFGGPAGLGLRAAACFPPSGEVPRGGA